MTGFESLRRLISQFQSPEKKNGFGPKFAEAKKINFSQRKMKAGRPDAGRTDGDMHVDGRPSPYVQGGAIHDPWPAHTAPQLDLG